MNEKSVVSFDSQLLDHIKNHQNVQAKSEISDDLVEAHDEFGTLLHYAVHFHNYVITQYLIELGSEVDAIGEGGKTPLVVAVYAVQEAIVKILLKAEANIDIADDTGESALQIVFRDDYTHEIISELFLHKVRVDASTTDESIDKLVSAGCTLYHATYLKDVKLLERMLARGFDINSCGGFWDRTVLHAAARLDDLDLAKWLVDKGADVNALDVHDQGPLYINAQHGNKEMLQFLLEQGADPNTTDLSDGCTPLRIAVGYSAGQEKQCIECVELLLQYGAVFQDESEEPDTIFDCALEKRRFQIINILIGHLAVLERLGTSIAKSCVRCNREKHREAFLKIQKDYELCQRTLNVAVFATSTLFDLLRESEEQMKVHLRNETFLPTIEHFCSEHNLKESCSYYYNKLMKSVSRADYLIKLENTAIPIICKLLQGDYSQCYIAARKICDYLNETDLVQLSRM